MYGKNILYPAGSRGGSDSDWLTSRFSFSFANWHDPERMGFGALRVLNDDIIAPGKGFGMHSHSNMEILTIVTKGILTHRDSLGTLGTLGIHDVQLMSAGNGIIHSEYNASDTETLELFQIWIEPRANGGIANYQQKSFSLDNLNQVEVLASRDGKDGSLIINQDAQVGRIRLQRLREYLYTKNDPKNAVFIFVISGTVTIENNLLNARDAISCSGSADIFLDANEACDLLLIEVPVSTEAATA